MNHSDLSDEKLFHLCRRYGTQARFWRQKFIGLLPEVNRRKLWEKKGFGSVFEFAAKLAGLSEEQVRLALNLEKRFEDKPILREVFENGEVSINKLSRIVSVATRENQLFWAAQAKILPKRALETLIHDEKIKEQNRNQTMEGIVPDGLFESQSDDKSLPGQTGNGGVLSAFLELELSTEVMEKLLTLKRKGIDINEVILRMLEKREEEIEEKKEEISATLRQAQGDISRYIPKKIKNLLHEEHGTKCSIATCSRKAETVHHTQRFSLSRNHDPRFLAPLCEEHHIIAHSIDQKFQQKRVAAVG